MVGAWANIGMTAPSTDTGFITTFNGTEDWTIIFWVQNSLPVTGDQYIMGNRVGGGVGFEIILRPDLITSPGQTTLFPALTIDMNFYDGAGALDTTLSARVSIPVGTTFDDPHMVMLDLGGFNNDRVSAGLDDGLWTNMGVMPVFLPAITGSNAFTIGQDAPETTIFQVSLHPESYSGLRTSLYEAGTTAGGSVAYSNPFRIEFTASTGTDEMYIKDGGAWVKSTPYVLVGGAWVESDAYVKKGGAWVPVYEKA